MSGRSKIKNYAIGGCITNGTTEPTYALSLTGTSQGASYGDILDSVIAGSGKWSVGVWMRLDEYETTSVITEKYGSDGVSRAFRLFYSDTAGVVCFSASADGTGSNFIQLNSNYKPALGVWNRYVLTVDISNGTDASKAKLYVNKRQTVMSVGSKVGTITSIYSGGASLMIGASQSLAVSTNGDFAKFIIWNKELSLSEVGTDYNNGIIDYTLSSISGVQLQSNLNNDYLDISGNNYTLTPSGSPTFELITNNGYADLESYAQQTAYRYIDTGAVEHLPHLQYNFTTTSQYLYLTTYKNTTSVSAMTVSIYKDGAFHSYVTGTNLKFDQFVVDLGDTASKTVKIVSGYASTYAGFLGIFIQNLRTSADYTIVPVDNTKKQFVLVADSIGTGRIADTPIEANGWFPQLREYLASTHNCAIYGVGGLAMSDLASDTANLVSRLANVLTSTNENTLILDLGVNDYITGRTGAQVGTDTTTVLNAIHTAFPTLEMFVFSPVIYDGETSVMTDIRDAIDTATDGRAYATYTSGLTLLNDTAQLNVDGIHPNQTGHNTKLANAKTALGV